MKKNTLKVAFIAAFAIVAGYNVYNSHKTYIMSDLALANIDALANIESNSDCNTYCTTDPNYDCIILYGSGVEGITCFDMRKR